MSPAQRRAVVSWAESAYRVSQRRACLALVIARSVIRYRSIKPDDAPVRRRLHELAAARPTFGARWLHVLLRRDGLRINRKKVRRLYREEGLQLKPRRRRRRAATLRQPRAIVTRANERWAMDVMHEALATGETIRVLTLYPGPRSGHHAARNVSPFTYPIGVRPPLGGRFRADVVVSYVIPYGAHDRPRHKRSHCGFKVSARRVLCTPSPTGHGSFPYQCLGPTGFGV